MPVKILRTWSWSCPDCGKTREMAETETDLGHVDSNAILRWCACDPSKLLEPASDERDAEPS